MSRRTYGTNNFISALNGGVTAGATSITLDTVQDLTAPGYLTLDPFVGSSREIIKFETFNGNAVETLTRGLAGSAGGVAQAHSNGAVVISAPVEQVIDDLFLDIEDLEVNEHVKYTDNEAVAAMGTLDDNNDLNHNRYADGDAVSAVGTPWVALISAEDHDHTTPIASHASSNDHPEATTGAKGLMSSGDKSKLDGIETSADANQSDAEILTQVKNVDGAGSGLDADLLDGVQLAGVGSTVIKFGTSQTVSVVAITTSPTDHHSFTFTKPGGWTTYSLVVMAIATYQGGSSGALLSAKVSVGGTESTNTLFNIQTSSMTVTAGVSVEKTGISGNQTIKMITQRSGGTQADAQATNYTMIAARTS